MMPGDNLDTESEEEPMARRVDPEPRRCCVCDMRLSSRDWHDHEDACIRRSQAKALAARRAARDAALATEAERVG